MSVRLGRTAEDDGVCGPEDRHEIVDGLLEESIGDENFFALARACLDIVLALTASGIGDSGARFNPQPHLILRSVAEHE